MFAGRTQFLITLPMTVSVTPVAAMPASACVQRELNPPHRRTRQRAHSRQPISTHIEIQAYRHIWLSVYLSLPTYPPTPLPTHLSTHPRARARTEYREENQEHAAGVRLRVHVAVTDRGHDREREI